MNRRLWRVCFELSLVAALAAPVLAQDPRRRLEPPLVKTLPRMLVYTVSAGFVHDVVKRESPDKPSIVEQALIDLGQETNHFEAVLSRDAADFTPEKLSRFALVFFYTTGELPFTKEQRDALFDFVKKGGAFAGAHSATDTFYEVPEYGAMIGAYFDGHPWHEKVKITVEDREHPATKHLGESFEITDEIYQFKAPYERKDLHVLLSLDTSTAGALDLSKPEIHRTDRDFANAWCKEYGKGRVFYTALGHRPEVWKDPRFLKHLDGGFRWAMRTDESAQPIAPPKSGDKKSGAKDEKKLPEDAAQSDDASALPLVSEGFAVDLIAQAPEILWPSVVHALPDGTLLVGEDRMDMPGPTDQPIDRIVRIRFRPDGTIERWVFADKLFAVFGIQEIDGDVYVMNMPHLTRLRDTDGDGVADERKEILTDLGPPAPGWPGGFNDHIVSGIRLGIDGFLYVAVGDKGIPLAHGTDGSTIALRGGGVVRVKPDGSRLEVVARGLRNILDVAIDARGEMFTYDNTDDGLGWWTRLSHVVAGGYYGYPWDYHEHQDRMLPCMKDYGGGSPCGGLVYREAEWPKQYHGNLFFCEWGKGAVRRFQLEPDRATFKVKSDEDFVRAGAVKSFRPLDLCESPDGRFLYVSDWAYDGWTAPAQAGRLWRIRRADSDPKTPSVARALPATIEGLVDALEDPSFEHRFRAQRALVRRGRDGVQPLRALLASDGKQWARIHALWALLEIDRERALEVLEIALTSKPVELRAQAVRALEGFPDYGGARLLPSAFNDPTVRMKREVLGLLAMGSEEVPPSIAKGLGNLFNSANPMYGTLPGTGDPVMHGLLMSALRRAHFVPDVAASKERALALDLLRDRWEPAVVDELCKVIRDDFFGVQTRVTSLGILASACKKPAPWDGKWWGIQPAKSAPPAHTIEWEKTDDIQRVVRACLADRAPDLRRAALEAVRDTGDIGALEEVRARYGLEPIQMNRRLALEVLAALHDENAGEFLARIVRDPATSQSLCERAVETASTIKTPAMIDLLCDVAADEHATAGEIVPCIRALGRLAEKRAAPVLVRRATSGAEEVRTAAVEALVAIEGREALRTIEPLLADPSAVIRRAAIRAYGTLPVQAAPLLLPLVDDEATRADAIEALAHEPDPSALSAYLAGLVNSAKTVRDASANAIRAVRDSVRADVDALAARDAISAPALAVLRSIYTEPQPIVRWKILGPFKRDETQPSVVVHLDGSRVLSSEIDALHPDWSRPMTGADGTAIGWTDVSAHPETGFVDLEKLLGARANVVAFAACAVHSSRERDAAMSAGSDDTLAVWVNGESARQFDGNRAFKADEDAFHARLKEGSNSIVVRIGNTTGQWSFNLRSAGDPADHSGPLFERAPATPGIAEYRAFALEHAGDPTRGYKLVREHSSLMCMRCHAINGTGEHVGPDLSDVAAKYSKEDIIASVLEPSKRIGEGYQSVTFEMKNGVAITGLVKSETDAEVLVFDVNGDLRHLERAEIESRTANKMSLMPEGQATLLSKEEFADVIAYLSTLRGAPGGKKP